MGTRARVVIDWTLHLWYDPARLGGGSSESQGEGDGHGGHG